MYLVTDPLCKFNQGKTYHGTRLIIDHGGSVVMCKIIMPVMEFIKKYTVTFRIIFQYAVYLV